MLKNWKKEGFIQEAVADPASGWPVTDLCTSFFIHVRQVVMTEYAGTQHKPSTV